MHPELDKLIEMALADGQVTDKEREIILRKAEKLGFDMDEVEMYLEGKLTTNVSSISLQIVEENKKDLVRKESKSEITNTRKFTPRKVTYLKPALLNKENEIELKISELSENKKILFNNLEELVNEIRISQRDLIKIKTSFDKQLNLKKDEFKNANANLVKFINEINTEIAKKYGGGKLIFDKPEEFIGLGYIELVNLIQIGGKFNIDELQKKRKKILLFLLLSIFPTFYYLGIFMQDYTSYNLNGYKALSIFVIIMCILYVIVILFNQIYSENFSENFNISSADLNQIIREVRRKNSNEFDELLRLKNEIIRLELIQENLKLKDITDYEKHFKVN